MQKIQLPYRSQTIQYFECIQNCAWSVYLDSGYNGKLNDNNRYEILTAEPLQRLEANEKTFEIIENNKVVFKSKDVYKALNYMLKSLPNESHNVFDGGLVGYLSYDLGNDFFKPSIKDKVTIPLAAVGLYQWCLLVDHKEKSATLLSWDEQYNLTFWKQKFKFATNSLYAGLSGIEKTKKSIDFAQYQKAFDKLQCYLTDGDCYQVNYAQRFSIKNDGDSFALFKQLKLKNKVPFGAYLNYPNFQVLSFSPECFLALEGEDVTTYPIKGTISRSANETEDLKLKNKLINSKKDQSENLMIVDLMRNDLGKLCKEGTIKVLELFDVKPFKYVYHMQSKITGKLKQGEDAISLLKNCFPGGSITGAPKRRAMEIIDELEVNNRGIYCGSIFYMTKHRMMSSIAIRTAINHKKALSFWAGGGIISESGAESEYQESLDKAKVFTQLIKD
jgi:para-aminobenzoate synthetase component 1